MCTFIVASNGKLGDCDNLEQSTAIERHMNMSIMWAVREDAHHSNAIFLFSSSCSSSHCVLSAVCLPWLTLYTPDAQLYVVHMAINACKFQIARMSQTIVAQPFRHLFAPLASTLAPFSQMANAEAEKSQVDYNKCKMSKEKHEHTHTQLKHPFTEIALASATTEYKYRNDSNESKFFNSTTTTTIGNNK